MKKILISLLTILLVVGICACGNQPQPAETTGPVVTTDTTTKPEQEKATAETTEATAETTLAPEVFVFPAGIKVWGVDMAGKTAGEGYAALSAKLRNYTLSFTVNDKSFRVSGGSMGLYYPEDAFMATAEAMADGQEASFNKSLRYSESALRNALSARTDKKAINASVAYNKAQQAFVVTPEADGYTTDLTEALQIASRIIPKLGSDSVSVQAEVTQIPAKITADDPAFSSAVNKANSMISVNLSYTYAPEGEEAQVETLSRNDLAGFLVFHEKDMSLSFSDSALAKYTKKMNDKYRRNAGRGMFRTTGGSTVNLMVDYSGRGIDTEELSRDIRHCMENGISGNRTATYLNTGTSSGMPYNGTYIEVNLSAQRIWFYKGGELIVTCPIVSGCVTEGWCTPTGVYSIYSKFVNRWISGGQYYVNYFMAYRGNYGLHDATWRNEFGGDIYLTEGSHGCPNLPIEAAMTIYRNSSIGTKVIIYGGVTSVDMITQEISGTGSYRLPSDSEPITLDAATVYGSVPLKYVSSDPNVVSVDADGRVQVKGIGSATITVTCEESGYYTAAEKIISFEVYSACEDGRHIYGEWVVITAPTCTTAGEHTGTCTVCSQSTTLPLNALDHDFTSGGEFCDRNCGTENPGYNLNPSEPEVSTPTEPEGSTPSVPQESTAPESEGSEEAVS